LIRKALVFSTIVACIASASAQTGAPTQRAHPQPLVLTGSRALASVHGRIDHLGVDYKGVCSSPLSATTAKKPSTWEPEESFTA